MVDELDIAFDNKKYAFYLEMVKNITVSHCAFNKSVNISWIVPNFTNIKDVTFIQVYSDSFLNEELPKVSHSTLFFSI